MKKYLFQAVISLLLIATPLSAMTLWEYYKGNLPSIEARTPTYNQYFNDEYHGTAVQNSNLVQALQDNQPAVENVVDNQNQQVSPLILGATAPQGVATFETSLLSSITSSASSMTLTANSVRGGSTLSGYQCFTVDEGSSIAEYICGTVSGTAVTSLTRGVDPITATSTNATLQFAHRRGAQVKITDFPLIQLMKHQLSGEETFDNLLLYNSITCSVTSSNYALCPKTYIDGVAVAGASNANTTTKGIVEIATVVETASTTSTGSTGATLAIPASSATSSPLRGCDGSSIAGALCVPVARNNGSLSPYFIGTTSADIYHFGGLIFNDGGLFASSTNNWIASSTQYNFNVGVINATSSIKVAGASVLTTASASITGVVSTTTTFTLPSTGNTTVSKTVICVAPKLVSGGGVSGLTFTNGATIGVETLEESYPSASDRWTVTVGCASNGSPGSCPGGTGTAYAMCVNP